MQYQVEYMSRPDEQDHVVFWGSNYRKACEFAKRMSDEHDGSACVFALDEVAGRNGEKVTQVVGHISYTFGIRDEATGVLRDRAA